MALRHSGMLEVNEFLVLDYIRERAATTRPEVARALGLSDSSVSRIVARLLKSGTVVESPGRAVGAGRPRGTIAFNHRAGAVIAIDLDGVECQGELADLAGSPLEQDVRPSRGKGGAFAALEGSIGALRAEATRRDLQVEAVAIGIPAILDPDTGVAVGGPAVEWEGFEIVNRLKESLNVPFLVENDANLAALAHAWRGQARGQRDFVTLVMGAGIGAAVVSSGRLVKGRHNAAGELGFLVTGREQLRALRRGRPDAPGGRLGGYGGLETVAAGPSIVARAQALASGTGSSLASGPVTVDRVFAAARDADPVALEVVEEVLDYTALAVIAVAVVADPALVIFDGSVGRALEPFLDELAARLEGPLLLAPELSVSKLGPNATVVGAVAAALQLTRERSAPSALFGEFAVSGRADQDA
jgi:glucokinase